VAVTREMLLSELKDLLRLTAFEQTVATVRRAQARTSPIERELAENAHKAGERLDLLKSAVASLGGAPDLVTPALGRAGAFVQTQVNQVQTLQGALLGDLALEHQLRERTRYARTLAQSLGEEQVLPVLDRLEVAHSATIEWLETRLAEVGRTGSSALRATPVQAVVTVARRAARVPFGVLTGGVNRAGGVVARMTGNAPQPLQDVLADVEDAAARASERVIDITERGTAVATSAGRTAAAKAEKAVQRGERTAERAGETATEAAGRAVEGAAAVADKAQGAAESAQDKAEDLESAAAEGASALADTAEQTAAQVTEQVLEATGGADVDDEKPPFAGYEKLTGDSIMRHIADTEDVDELRTLLAFEQANKARKGVLKAAQERLDQLAGAGASA
jgi:bacterioferritin (cytochrome b1)